LILYSQTSNYPADVQRNAEQITHAIMQLIDGFEFPEVALAILSVHLDIVCNSTPSHEEAKWYVRDVCGSMSAGIDLHFKAKGQ
jgi:hypothetical protein